MARLARQEYLDPNEIQVVHVTSRCVRRAFLCGTDVLTGQSFEHRREWIRERLEGLAGIFGIDCLTFALMSNHLHLVLRSRPDVVLRWSDEEVAQRWVRLCPSCCNGQSAATLIRTLAGDSVRIQELRKRLSDVSWWMRMVSQKIAQMANKEDGCTGRFWEGRYNAQLLLDEAAVLACSMYVDLNPVRAAMAESLETSDFTGAKARIDDIKADKPNRYPAHWERSQARVHCGWLSPLEHQMTAASEAENSCVRRASSKGFLSMSLPRYIELLDWTGQQLIADKRGSLPKSVHPILKRLGIEPSRWFDLARQFGRLFKRAAGSRVSLSKEAIRRGQRWLQAPGADCFS